MSEAPGGTNGGQDGSVKGLMKSLSEGVRNLLVLDEKLTGLGKEGDRTRAEVRELQSHVHRLLGKLEEMEKRITERFAELDKRLGEMDKRIDLRVELAVRNEMDKRSASEHAHRVDSTVSKRRTSELAPQQRGDGPAAEAER